MYYRRNLRKEVRFPTSHLPAIVQNFELPRDQGMENLTKPCTDNNMSENDRFNVLENVEKKNNGDKTEIGNSDDQVSVDKEQYQCPVGKLIYLSHTLPDIFFIVSVVN
ncbi:reverse transcriptase [Cucumis melo var. makuwa]|uniref:Reverse transcriptase n=1 Tax=Cucumis melo var. makuwa TaxID=1194695 RepID=A0A5D3B9S6_CUCMM|nr:reverse transcriptase [Cucumis melo var. makuwa]